MQHKQRAKPEMKADTRRQRPTIDDGRHGQDNTIAVIDDGVHRFIFNNVKVMPQVAVCLYESKEKQRVSSAQTDK